MRWGLPEAITWVALNLGEARSFMVSIIFIIDERLFRFTSTPDLGGIG